MKTAKDFLNEIQDILPLIVRLCRIPNEDMHKEICFEMLMSTAIQLILEENGKRNGKK